MDKKQKKQKLTPQEIKARRKTLLIVFIICMIILVTLATPLIIMESQGIITRP
ncbi:hypothetical protein [Mycoplasma todarodis]|uniref:hypothetical protein n=1 Tax=Mycoplasma todarodis TaxID=1937191 RepID=UPI001443C147|nr:hypothetical protein [Mycoplasma todarodis]